MSNVRKSVTKLNMAVMRRIVDATRGLDIAFLIWVSTVLLAIRPTLSAALCKTAGHRITA